jgi:HAE1 family hydrophobic/amphiphilic exporter-1
MDVQAIVDRFADAAPAGIEISAGGVAADQEEAFAGMAIALLVAVALVYLVMVVSFGSLSTPFVILFSLPLALIGVLGALAITGKTLGLPALIGVLMLVGIVVTNAIVLLEYVIELRHKGRPLDEAIIEGGKVRLRPILMTAIATILALTPLAASTESGAIIASDLAVVVIGGLLTSTLLTLLVVPAAYKIVGGWHERRAAKSADRDDAPLVEPTL